MRTPKIHSLYKLIDFLNKYKQSTINKMNIDDTPLNILMLDYLVLLRQMDRSK